MPNANAPAGPGRPIVERKDAVDTREQIDELEALPDPSELPPGSVPRAGPGGTQARQAERNAVASGDAEEDERQRATRRSGAES